MGSVFFSTMFGGQLGLARMKCPCSGRGSEDLYYGDGAVSQWLREEEIWGYLQLPILKDNISSILDFWRSHK